MTFQCNAELVPSAVMVTTCTDERRWNPPPENLNCAIVAGIFYSHKHADHHANTCRFLFMKSCLQHKWMPILRIYANAHTI